MSFSTTTVMHLGREIGERRPEHPDEVLNALAVLRQPRELFMLAVILGQELVDQVDVAGQHLRVEALDHLLVVLVHEASSRRLP